MSCSKMSKAVSSSAVDSQILPDGSPVVDSSMPSVELYAAASPMLLRAADEPTETVLVITDWYAPHLVSPNPNEIVEDLIQRFSAGILRIRPHEIAVGISNRHGQTLLPNGLHWAAWISAAVSFTPSYESSVGDVCILPNEGINWSRTNRLPSETSSDSGGETDPEMPALIDDRPIRAEYVGHRFRINGQVIPTPRTSEEHPGWALRSVSRNHLVAALEGLD